jgi:glycylpeptide N-tetradecanoyltransferase
VDFSPAEVEHFLMPQDDVIYSFVVVDPESREITDVCSFYSLTSSILKHP